MARPPYFSIVYEPTTQLKMIMHTNPQSERILTKLKKKIVIFFFFFIQNCLTPLDLAEREDAFSFEALYVPIQTNCTWNCCQHQAPDNPSQAATVWKLQFNFLISRKNGTKKAKKWGLPSSSSSHDISYLFLYKHENPWLRMFNFVCRWYLSE